MQRTEQFLERYRDYQAGQEPAGDPTRPVTALAIDGGGVRGLVPAMVLAEIERRTGRPIWRDFDLISGTSTGGLLALALAAPGDGGQARWTAAQLVDLYRTAGETIFYRGLLRVPGSQLLFNKYAAKRLERALRERLENTTLCQALTGVVVTSWNLTEHRPAYFNSAEARIAGWDLPMREIARATSAAPTFFKPCWITSPPGSEPIAYIDGGVFANNPAKIAYLAAQPPNGSPRPVMLVSVGTGDPPPFNPLGRRFWGALPWAAPMLHLFMTAPSELVDVDLRQLAGANFHYHRFAPPPGAASPHLDDASPGNIAKLETAATELIASCESALDSICSQLRGRE